MGASLLSPCQLWLCGAGDESVGASVSQSAGTIASRSSRGPNGYRDLEFLSGRLAHCFRIPRLSLEHWNPPERPLPDYVTRKSPSAQQVVSQRLGAATRGAVPGR